MTDDRNARGGSGAVSGVRNLDVVLPGVIELHGPHKTYRLRDDIGALLGLVGYRVQAMMAGLPTNEEARELPIAELVARTSAYEAELLAACVAFFRHTYPDISEDEVRETLPTEGSRMAVMAAFFTSRSAPSGAPPNASAGENPSSQAQEANPDADTETDAAGGEQPSDRPAPASPSSPAATSKSRRSSRRS